MAQALHTIAPAEGSRSGRRRIGRGNASGMGTYSTRGAKGQRARSGGRRGLKLKGMKRIVAALPKMHGMKSKRVKPEEVKIAALVAAFGEGAKVTLRELKAKGLVSRTARAAKVIGSAKVAKKIALEGVEASASAKASIESAGGTIGA